MRALLKRDIVVDDKLLLKSVWDFKLYEFKDGIEEITDQAKQELKMEKQLNIIIKFWQDIEYIKFYNRISILYSKILFFC